MNAQCARTALQAIITLIITKRSNKSRRYSCRRSRERTTLDFPLFVAVALYWLYAGFITYHSLLLLSSTIAVVHLLQPGGGAGWVIRSEISFSFYSSAVASGNRVKMIGAEKEFSWWRYPCDSSKTNTRIEVIHSRRRHDKLYRVLTLLCATAKSRQDILHRCVPASCTVLFPHSCSHSAR